MVHFKILLLVFKFFLIFLSASTNCASSLADVISINKKSDHISDDENKLIRIRGGGGAVGRLQSG